MPVEPTTITEELVEIAGVETFVRRVQGDGVPTVFVHGNPTSSADWVPFMRALGAPAIAFDLPCFGRSERVPAERFEATMHGYAGFVATALDSLCEGPFQLVVHDWGGIALHPAQRRAHRLRRLVVIDAVPLLAGYRWHWIARIWRRRGLGELFCATMTKPALAATLRLARPGLRPMPPEMVDEIWSAWDRRMAAAVLGLYRSADPDALEAAGAHLDRLVCPALVVWGRQDPYLGPEVGRRYAERLPGAELLELDPAGHWPWIDRPEVVEQVASFLRA